MTVTWAHHRLMEGNHSQATQSLLFTILLGIYHPSSMWMLWSPFHHDAVYGSTFFVGTGFDGLHMISGTNLLLSRHLMSHFSISHHCGFEAAAWYWYFTVVAWLFLYISIYWWVK